MMILFVILSLNDDDNIDLRLINEKRTNLFGQGLSCGAAAALPLVDAKFKSLVLQKLKNR